MCKKIVFLISVILLFSGVTFGVDDTNNVYDVNDYIWSNGAIDGTAHTDTYWASGANWYNVISAIEGTAPDANSYAHIGNFSECEYPSVLRTNYAIMVDPIVNSTQTVDKMRIGGSDCDTNDLLLGDPNAFHQLTITATGNLTVGNSIHMGVSFAMDNNEPAEGRLLIESDGILSSGSEGLLVGAWGGHATVDVNGQLTSAGGMDLGRGDHLTWGLTSEGTLNINNSFGLVQINNYLGVGRDYAKGTVNVNDGELKVSQYVYLGSGLVEGSSPLRRGKGYMNVNGGTVSVTAKTTVGLGKGYGELNVNSGLYQTLGDLVIGDWQTQYNTGGDNDSTGKVTISGGTLEAWNLILNELAGHASMDVNMTNGLFSFIIKTEEHGRQVELLKPAFLGNLTVDDGKEYGEIFDPNRLVFDLDTSAYTPGIGDITHRADLVTQLIHKDEAWRPGPVNGTYGVPARSAKLSWQAGAAAATSYDVYFGTNETPGGTPANVTGLTHTVSLDPNTTYYWKVVTNIFGGSVDGQKWSFKTHASHTQAGLTYTNMLGDDDLANAFNWYQLYLPSVNDSMDIQDDVTFKVDGETFDFDELNIGSAYRNDWDITEVKMIMDSGDISANLVRIGLGGWAQACLEMNGGTLQSSGKIDVGSDGYGRIIQTDGLISCQELRVPSGVRTVGEDSINSGVVNMLGGTLAFDRIIMWTEKQATGRIFISDGKLVFKNGGGAGALSHYIDEGLIQGMGCLKVEPSYDHEIIHAAAPTIDGVIGSQWDTANWMAVDTVLGSRGNSASLTARYKTMWNSTTNRIYVLMEVVDANGVFAPVQAYNGGGYEGEDHFEIMFDGGENNAPYRIDKGVEPGALAQQWVIGSDGTASGSWMNLGGFEYLSLYGDIASGDKPDYAVTYTSGTNTTVLEIALVPYNYFGAQTGKTSSERTGLIIGDTVGFEPSYCNRSDATTDAFELVGDDPSASKSSRASRFSIFELVGTSYVNADSTETAVVAYKADVNGDCLVNFEDFATLANHWME